MTAADTEENIPPLDVMLDPKYQANLMVIDDAMELIGSRKRPADLWPSHYDDALLKLIDAVPLED